MSMHFPYTNQNTTIGHYLYNTAAYPNFAVNHNPYFSTYYSNQNGLLPIPSQTLIPPLIERNKSIKSHESQRIIPKIPISHVPIPSSHKIHEEKKDNNSNDFLTFIEKKAKSKSDLNPFANEFSAIKNNVSNATTNTDEIVVMNYESNSSYKGIFDDLIEQSLQSIEAIKNASKYIFNNFKSFNLFHLT